MKQTIRLNESELNRLISESVKNILNEDVNEYGLMDLFNRPKSNRFKNTNDEGHKPGNYNRGTSSASSAVDNMNLSHDMAKPKSNIVSKAKQFWNDATGKSRNELQAKLDKKNSDYNDLDSRYKSSQHDISDLQNKYSNAQRDFETQMSQTHRDYQDKLNRAQSNYDELSAKADKYGLSDREASTNHGLDKLANANLKGNNRRMAKQYVLARHIEQDIKQDVRDAGLDYDDVISGIEKAKNGFDENPKQFGVNHLTHRELRDAENVNAAGERISKYEEEDSKLPSQQVKKGSNHTMSKDEKSNFGLTLRRNAENKVQKNNGRRNVSESLIDYTFRSVLNEMMSR